MERSYELTDAELELIEIFWNTEERPSFKELMEHLNEVLKRDWKKQALSTCLKHLQNEGMIGVYKRNSKYYPYYSLVTKDRFLQEWTKKTANQSSGNSLSDFVATFTGGNRLNKEEVARLRKYLQQIFEDNQYSIDLIRLTLFFVVFPVNLHSLRRILISSATLFSDQEIYNGFRKQGGAGVMQYGYFDNENREYVISRVDLPASWTDYLGIKDMCTLVNRTAGGYLFYKSPEYHRITGFRGDEVPMGRPGHYVYMRNDKTGEYWSISWQPVGRDLSQAKYTCRYGPSYSRYEYSYQGTEASQTLPIPKEGTVELRDMKFRNNSDRERHLGVYSYCEFSFHHIEPNSKNLQMSLYAVGSSYEGGIIEHDLFYKKFDYQYFTMNQEPGDYNHLRDTFPGEYRIGSNPIIVGEGKCRGNFEKGSNRCDAL